MNFTVDMRVCLASGMHAGVCFKFTVRTGGGNAEQGSYYQIIAALPVPYVQESIRLQ